MFDIGFWELVLIGVVALLVVGPERLPGLAVTVGQWVGRARRYVNHMRREIEEELDAENLKNLLDEQSRELQSLRREVADVKNEAETAVRYPEPESWGGTSGTGDAESPAPADAEREADVPTESGADDPAADQETAPERPATTKKKRAAGKKKSAKKKASARKAGAKKRAAKKTAGKKTASRREAAAPATEPADTGADDAGRQHSDPDGDNGR